MPKAEWIVNIKGDAECENFEISVIRKDNHHGIQSYGWFDENKLLISHNGGPCQWPVIKPVWDMLINVAALTARKLNEQEETTPKCKCGSISYWVLRRELVERMTWEPDSRKMIDKEIECTEVSIFCSDCGYDLPYEDPNILFYELLEGS